MASETSETSVAVKLPQTIMVKLAVVSALTKLPRGVVLAAWIEEIAEGHSGEELAELDIYPEPVPRKRKAKSGEQ